MAATDLNLKRQSAPINRHADREGLLVFLSCLLVQRFSLLIHSFMVHAAVQCHENMMISFPLPYFPRSPLAFTDINLSDSEHMTHKIKDS